MNQHKRIWRADITLESIKAKSPGTLAGHLGIEVIELGLDFLTGAMMVDERTCQPMRILHGGASVVLAETLASYAANCVVEPHLACVGQEINANHLRPVPVGHRVIGTTRPFHIGARSQVWGIELFNEHQQRVCVSRITMAVIQRTTQYT